MSEQASPLDQLHWSAATQHHDWSADAGAIPRRMLDQLRDGGVTGELAWLSTGPSDRKVKIASWDEVGKLLRNGLRPGESIRLGAGGSEPRPWSMTLLLMPFDEESGEVRGYSMVSLTFDSPRRSGPQASDALAALFQAVHSADDTETAYIHPHPRWSQLSDRIGGEYGAPVTFSPFFDGVFWMTFLGRGHLELFDPAKLNHIDTYQVERSRGGLVLRVTRDVADAQGAEAEREMLRLTQLFREALK